MGEFAALAESADEVCDAASAVAAIVARVVQDLGRLFVLQISTQLRGAVQVQKDLSFQKTDRQRQSVLFQIRHLIDNDMQIKRIKEKSLFDLDYQIMQGKGVQGVVIGGNIRCFLKLAGTRYFPEVKDKLLLLEAYSGNEAKLVTYLSQLKQMHVFEQIQGLILGTYTEYFKNHDINDLLRLVKRYVSDDLTIIYTKDIGHSKNAKAIVIGKEYFFY